MDKYTCDIPYHISMLKILLLACESEGLDTHDVVTVIKPLVTLLEERELIGVKR